MLISCGGTEASEKARRQSSRFYEAASIAWFDENDTLAAIRSLTRSIEANPDNDDAHYLLGIIRLSRGEYEAAEKHLRETIRLRTDRDAHGLAGARNNLGVLLIHQKRYQEAIEQLKASSSEVMNREPWLAFGNLGWAYIELGDYDKAIEALRRAVFEQPKYCVGKYRLGQAFYLKKEFAAAVSVLKQAIETPEPGCSDLQEAYHLLGMDLIRLENDDEAREFLIRCVKINEFSKVGLECREALDSL
jgi:tetratricopeptide (TPR) repeat protein